MKKRASERTGALRQQAEERLSEHASAASPSAADAAALVHELQVHQIELEMQNEELQAARHDAEVSRARFADLYDFAPVGYFTLARDSAIREVNLTGARMLGVERARLIGRRMAAFLSEADLHAFDDALLAALERGTQQECGATLARLPDATRPSTFLQLTIFAPPGGDELRVAAVDATERRRSEEQVRTSQKLEAIGQLAGGVAHDFNNLLTVIMSNCALAFEAVTPDAPVHEHLVEMNGAAERAAALTRQLLAFSRKQVVLPRVVDLNALVRDAVTMLRRLVTEDIEIALSLAANLAPVELDPVQLDQVILNLAVNARDAMSGGGKLTISTSNLDAHAGPSSLGNDGRSASSVRLTVSDNGTGMDAKTMDHVFEPFFTTKGPGQGTGLGLSTVFGIVKGCGGTISVRSELGIGTTFEIDFPHSRGVASPLAPARRANEPVPRGTETVLVVEDEPALLRIALRVLTSTGYTALGASNGDEALVLCERHAGTIHLALSDIVMPGMSGVTFGERLRRVHPETKMLFMSGYTAEALARHRTGDPAFELLNKPFTPDELKRKVRQMLDLRRSIAPANE